MLARLRESASVLDTIKRKEGKEKEREGRR